jgi:hypothetical protein
MLSTEANVFLVVEERFSAEMSTAGSSVLILVQSIFSSKLSSVEVSVQELLSVELLSLDEGRVSLLVQASFATEMSFLEVSASLLVQALFVSELLCDRANTASLLVQAVTVLEIDGLLVTECDLSCSFATLAAVTVVLVRTFDVVIAHDVVALLDVFTALDAAGTYIESLVAVFGLLSCELHTGDLEVDVVTLVWL